MKPIATRTPSARSRQRAARLAAEATEASVRKLMAIASQSPVEHGNGGFEIPSVGDALAAIHLLLKLGETAADEKHEMSAEQVLHSLGCLADRLGYTLVPKTPPEGTEAPVDASGEGGGHYHTPEPADTHQRASQAFVFQPEPYEPVAEVLPPDPPARRACPHCGSTTCDRHRDVAQWNVELARERAERGYRSPSAAWPRGRIVSPVYSAEHGSGNTLPVVFTGRRNPR